jgi:hypothetical protein
MISVKHFEIPLDERRGFEWSKDMKEREIYLVYSAEIKLTKSRNMKLTHPAASGKRARILFCE